MTESPAPFRYLPFCFQTLFSKCKADVRMMAAINNYHVNLPMFSDSETCITKGLLTLTVLSAWFQLPKMHIVK